MLIEANTDDAWNLFNLLSTGDFVYGTCYRKVAKETLTGLVKNEKKTFPVLLKVTKFEYDPDVDIIRILGVNARENKYIAMGAYQSIDLKAPMKTPVTIIKKQFDSVHVRKLNEAANEAS